MKTRVLVGAALLVLLGGILAFGPLFRSLVFTAAALISVFEMGRAFHNKGFRPCLWPLYLFAGAYYLLYRYGMAYYGNQAWGAGVYMLAVLCLVLLCGERIFNQKRTMEDMAASLFVLVYPLGLYVALMLTSEWDTAALLLCFAGPLMGDTAAYFVGSALGKHKLCPHISPKKTVEGSIGGFIGGALGGLLTFALQGVLPGSQHFHLGALMAIGLLCGGVGQIGDLFASTIKRWAGIKDYGNIFPGHGGIMDRLDSVLMCAPVVYALLFMPVFMGAR